MMKNDVNGEEPWLKALQGFLSKNSGILVRLRGLPYECTAAQVVDFFRSGSHPCDVKDGEKGVYFIKKPDGKATGDALALFSNESDASAAMTRHKDLIGTRYIELFRTPHSEVELVVRRTLEAKSKPMASRISQQIVLPPPSQQTIPCGPTRDCIRLRALPFEAQVHHLLDFLGPHAKNIVYQGVHMVYNHLGQPSGEAFVQMNSEAAAAAAASCHNGIMTLGKKQRYVEVFQCSGEDMSAFLSGVLPPLPSPVAGLGEMLPPLLPMFPPGMLEGRCQPLSSGPPGRPLLYVLINPSDRFITVPQAPEWLPEYPPSPILSQPIEHTMPSLPDYFVS